MSSLSLQFSKESLANMYSAYIDNFLNAKDAVRIAKEAKPAFHKFLEVSYLDPGTARSAVLTCSYLKKPDKCLGIGKVIGPFREHLDTLEL